MRYMNTPNERILLPGPDHSLRYLDTFRFKGNANVVHGSFHTESMSSPSRHRALKPVS